MDNNAKKKNGIFIFSDVVKSEKKLQK